MTTRETSRQRQSVPLEHPSTKDHLRQIARVTNEFVKWQALHPIDTPTTVSATYTMVDSDSLILCKADNPITIFLLTAAAREGRELTIKKIDAGANPVIVDAKDAETIDGVTTKTLSAQYSSLRIKSDNTNWWGVGGSNAVADGNWIPLVDGSEPPNFITDGAGVLITVWYTP